MAVGNLPPACSPCLSFPMHCHQPRHHVWPPTAPAGSSSLECVPGGWHSSGLG